MPYLDAADAINAPRTPLPTGPLTPEEAWSRLPLIGGPTLRVVELSMPAGTRTIPHYHPRSAEFFFVLAGSGEWWIGDGGPRTAAHGELFYAPIGVVHAIVAGPAGLRFLAGNAPNEDAPDEQVEVELEGYPL